MREVVMATGTSYRTPGTLPSQTSGFAGRAAGAAAPLHGAVARVLSDAGSSDERA
jgi:hypothetical protein